jgi:hypothetical protein
MWDWKIIREKAGEISGMKAYITNKEIKRQGKGKAIPATGHGGP